MELDTNTIIIAIGIVVIVAALLGNSLYRKKQRVEAAWEGVVIDKAVQEQVQQPKTNTTNPSGVSVNNISVSGQSQNTPAITHVYSITVRSSAGTTFNWPVSSGFYETVGIGDTLSKHPGQEVPNITQKAQVAQQPPESPVA